PVTVKMDPRVKTAPVSMQQNFQTVTRLARLMTSSTEAIREARSVVQQAEELKSPLTVDVVKKARDLITELTRVNGQVSGLYEQVSSADTAPTAAQMSATGETAVALGPVRARWESVAGKDVPALNEKLKAAGLKEIEVEKDDKNGDTDTADDEDDVG
ncbi:MAG TPA: hypothetical protein VNH18_16280, partial [Bryobacteraceae bacterium]|nr:hypothetical protein [Bryobacteraceae bacterium]